MTDEPGSHAFWVTATRRDGFRSHACVRNINAVVAGHDCAIWVTLVSRLALSGDGDGAPIRGRYSKQRGNPISIAESPRRSTTLDAHLNVSEYLSGGEVAMDAMIRGKFLIGAVLALGSIGLVLSACAAPAPEGAYASGYYDYPDYYDPGYIDSFGFVDRDHREHHRRHDHDHDYDHDEGMPHGMHAGVYAMHSGAPGPMITHGFTGGGGIAGSHGGGAGHR